MDNVDNSDTIETINSTNPTPPARLTLSDMEEYKWCIFTN